MKDATIKVGGGIAQGAEGITPMVVVAVVSKLTQEQMATYSFSTAEAMELGLRLLSTAHEVTKDADVFMFLREQATLQGLSAEDAGALAGQQLANMRAMRTKRNEPAAAVVPN